MKLSIEKQTLAGFGIASAVLVGINALSYWSSLKHQQTTKWVSHTHQVLQKLESTHAELTEAETGQRGYLITGQESYLEVYDRSIGSVNQHIQELQTLIADNADQQQLLYTLKPLIAERLAALSQVIELRKDEGFGAARIGVKTSRGTEIMTRIRQVLREMENEETELLEQRVKQQQTASITQNLVFSMGILFNIVVFYWLYRAISHEIAQRQQAQAGLQQMNEHLEHRVEERTTALQAANQALSAKINALQETEAALQDNYNLLETIINSNPNPIFVRDLQGRYRFMNVPGAALFNKSIDEIVGRDSCLLFPPEATTKVKADDERIFASGQAETYEETLAIDGEWRTYLTTKTAYRDAQGNIEGLVGFSRDITYLKQAEKALRYANEELEQRVRQRTAELEQVNATLAEREALLRLFIENVPLAVAMFDRQMRYLATSQRWLEDYHLGEQDIIGRSHYEVFPEIADRWQAVHQRCLAGITAKFEEDYFLRADGTENWERREIHPWRNSIGEVGGLVIFTENITQRKEADEKLKEANAELVRSNSELEQFAYVASHDLREPLRKIKSYTELLAEDYQGQLDATADKYMAYITDGAERMQALISDLLTYSRVGKGDLTKEPVNLESVVNRILTDLSLTISETNAKITLKPLPTIDANFHQMVQLYQNLIANALKFRGEAPPEILIQAQLKHDQWLFSIQDNGIGIKPQYLERIFVIFQRLHSRSKYPGTGIGLAICRKIVERHGGQIWVESEERKGTTFYFTFPYASKLVS
ncbi:MAG: CHASE3 domain-containing protein [Coleofasciculus sp. S288]|nr:CHASE3 domain-containing protein [Coleofasciculus sp. S288]